MAKHTPEQLEPHRRGLMGHCYRMLGSIEDAEDAVQETMLRAVRGLERFEGRSQLRTWLYRIATNVCFDARSQRDRRRTPVDEGPSGTPEDELTTHDRNHWLEPIPDEDALPDNLDLDAQIELRKSIRVAFVAALQHLPAKQRAALLLADVVGCSAAEVAESLETTVPAVQSAIQRAREGIARRVPERRLKSQFTDDCEEVVGKFLRAFEAYDIERLTALLAQDVRMSMPPYTLWLQGRSQVACWLAGRGNGCRGSRLVPLRANGQPAFGHYRQAGQEPWSILVLEIDAGQVTDMTYFLDTDALFPRFGLPRTLGASNAGGSDSLPGVR